MTHRNEDWWECTCTCHEPDSHKRHATLCCGWCGHCHKHIAGDRQAHERECAVRKTGMSALQRSKLFTQAAQTYRHT